MHKNVMECKNKNKHKFYQNGCKDANSFRSEAQQSLRISYMRLESGWPSCCDFRKFEARPVKVSYKKNVYLPIMFHGEMNNGRIDEGSI